MILVLGSIAVGCSRTPPYHQTVKADSSIGLVLWRSKMADSLSPAEWALFDRAIQEIKYKVMNDHEASGSEAIERVMRTKIDGMQLYDVVRSGLQLRLKRLLAEKVDAEAVITANAQLRTRPGDEDSADMLAEIRRTQAARLERIKNDIEAAKDELSRLKNYARSQV